MSGLQKWLSSLWNREATSRAIELDPQWLSDPLTHPQIRRLSERELGDLPIGHPQSRMACEG